MKCIVINGQENPIEKKFTAFILFMSFGRRRIRLYIITAISTTGQDYGICSEHGVAHESEGGTIGGLR